MEKLDVYNVAEAFSDKIWNLVDEWNYFQKDTIGKQMTKAADSISANIAEGYGRHYYKESKQFYFYARGSVQETKVWLSKCKRRQLVEESICTYLLEEAEKILAMLNAYIKFVANSQKSASKTNTTNKRLNGFTE
ncbi:MAG TPA: four helix bundle protein [Flavisolibacter sp.]|nr:four helix bundle protein [Flavisolibacter sp.]